MPVTRAPVVRSSCELVRITTRPTSIRRAATAMLVSAGLCCKATGSGGTPQSTGAVPDAAGPASTDDRSTGAGGAAGNTVGGSDGASSTEGEGDAASQAAGASDGTVSHGAGDGEVPGDAVGETTAGSPGDAAHPTMITAGVRFFGRVDTVDPAGPRFAWSGTGLAARWTGPAVSVRLDNSGPCVFKAVIDGLPQPAFTAAQGQGTYPLAAGLDSTTHTVFLYRQTEGVFGDSRFLGLTVPGGTLLDPPAAPARLIEVVGASVSCGYGNLGVSPCSFSIETESHWDTYESVAARALGAELSVVAISGRGIYRNSDGTTEGTMPKLYGQILASSSTPSWDFRTTPQVVVINLGKNDLVLGDPGPAFPSGYLEFTRTLRSRYPSALIVGTTGPNLGDAAHALQLRYVTAVVATRHAEGDDQIELLDWSEQTPEESGCDVHPNAAKHRRMGEELAALIAARLGW